MICFRLAKTPSLWATLVVFLVALNPGVTKADIVESRIVLSSITEIENGDSDSDKVAGDSGSLSVRSEGRVGSATENSRSQAQSSFGFKRNSMIARAYSSLEKTTDALDGGLHSATSQLTMSFATDSRMRLELEGNFGFSGVTGEDDVLGWRVTDGTNILMQRQANPRIAGLDRQSFSESLVLNPGNYTFSIASQMQETIRLTDKREAAFQLSRFQISAAVPEPSSTSMGILLLSMFSLKRTRRA